VLEKHQMPGGPVPLSETQLSRLQSEIVREAKRTLVGRRFINVFGPLGAGVESISFDTYDEDETAEIHLEGQSDPKRVRAHTAEEYRRIPLIYKDFFLHWRDIKWSQDMGAPIDAANAIMAAHAVAHREDELVFSGHEDLRITGLLNVPGAHRLEFSSWMEFGSSFQDLLKAVNVLKKSNHHSPYAVAMSTDAYYSLIKGDRHTPFLELDQIQRLCTDGVFEISAIPPRTGVLVSTGDQNFDIAVAEDLSIAYTGSKDMNYGFRVYESLVLRVKRAKAVCVFTLAAS
jgi:uncharacterized linocin/CFP29 family protein